MLTQSKVSTNQTKEGRDSEAESHFTGHTEKFKKNFSVCEYVAIHPLMNGHAKENRDAIRAFFLAGMSRLDASQICLSQACQIFHHQCEGAKVYPILTLWVELISGSHSERSLCSFGVICPCYIISFSRAMLILTKYGKLMRDRKDS